MFMGFGKGRIVGDISDRGINRGIGKFILQLGKGDRDLLQDHPRVRLSICCSPYIQTSDIINHVSH
jgi:hypothetical protein